MDGWIKIGTLVKASQPGDLDYCRAIRGTVVGYSPLGTICYVKHKHKVKTWFTSNVRIV